MRFVWVVTVSVPVMVSAHFPVRLAAEPVATSGMNLAGRRVRRQLIAGVGNNGLHVGSHT